MCNREISSRRIDWFFHEALRPSGADRQGGGSHQPPLHGRRWQNTEYGRGLKEHRSDVKFHCVSNAIVLHIEKCNNFPDWGRTSLLEKNVKEQTRKMLEAAHIITRDTFNSRSGFITWSSAAARLAVGWTRQMHVTSSNNFLIVLQCLHILPFLSSLRAEREARSESTSIYRRKVSMSGRPAGRPWSRSLNAYFSGTGWPIHERSS